MPRAFSRSCPASWTARSRAKRLAFSTRMVAGAVAVDVGEQLDEAGPPVDRIGAAHGRVVELADDLQPVRLGVGGHRVALALARCPCRRRRSRPSWCGSRRRPSREFRSARPRSRASPRSVLPPDFVGGAWLSWPVSVNNLEIVYGPGCTSSRPRRPGREHQKALRVLARALAGACRARTDTSAPPRGGVSRPVLPRA